MEISRKRQEQFENPDAVTTQAVFSRTEDELKLQKYIGSYSTFEGSPVSKDIFQFDMWGVEVNDSLWNWTALREKVKEYGIRNSLLVAPMPTASTSQIMGFNECFEPFTSNLYTRNTLAGQFIVINKYLMKELIGLGLWDNDMKEQIIIHEGMIGEIKKIPQEVRDLYKTAWEIKQKHIIDLAADRGAFVCKSQSMNLFMESPDTKKLTMMHFYSWQKGVKTGMYYLRTKPKANVQQFTINPCKSKSNTTSIQSAESMIIEDDEVCTACSA